jgi:hypothetical protein
MVMPKKSILIGLDIPEVDEDKQHIINLRLKVIEMQIEDLLKVFVRMGGVTSFTTKVKDAD